MRLAAALVLVAALVGCGGDDRETAPVAWCNNTGQLLYLLDQHSTTVDAEALGGPEPVLGLAVPEVVGRRE